MRRWAWFFFGYLVAQIQTVLLVVGPDRAAANIQKWLGMFGA